MSISLITLMRSPLTKSVISSFNSRPSSTHSTGKSLGVLKLSVSAKIEKVQIVSLQRAFRAFKDQLTDLVDFLQEHVELHSLASSKRDTSHGLEIHEDAVLFRAWRQTVDKQAVPAVSVEEMWHRRDNWCVYEEEINFVNIRSLKSSVHSSNLSTQSSRELLCTGNRSRPSARL